MINSGANAVKSVLWSSIEKFSTQGVQFLLNIIIARLVAPSDFGLIAMTGIFISVAQVFVDGGFSNALIQKLNRNEDDYSTVFYFNIIIAIFLYAVLYCSSYYISLLYHEPALNTLVKFVGINFIISSLSIVHRTKLSISLDFKKIAIISLVSIFISGFLGVVLAYLNWGVWAILIQSLLNNILNTIGLILVVNWKPLFVFSKKSFIILFSFGSRIMIVFLIGALTVNLYPMMIGLKYNATDVGYFTRAYTLAIFISEIVPPTVGKALYPIFCKEQNNIEKLSDILNKTVFLINYLLIPVIIGVAFFSKDLVLFVLTHKWLSISSLISIISISTILHPMSWVYMQSLFVVGNSKLYLKVDIIKRTISIVVLFFTMSVSLKFICYGLFFYYLTEFIVSLYYLRSYLILSYRKIFNSLVKVIFVSCCVVSIVYFMSLFISVLWIKLVIVVFSSCFMYLLISKIFNFMELSLIIKILGNIINAEKK